LLFQIHAFAAWVLFAMWPFTRLVHVGGLSGMSGVVVHKTAALTVQRARRL